MFEGQNLQQPSCCTDRVLPESVCQCFLFYRLDLLLGFMGILMGRWQSVNWVQLPFLITAGKLYGTSWCVAKDTEKPLLLGAEPMTWPLRDAEIQEQDGSLGASPHLYIFLLNTPVLHVGGRPDGQVEGSLAASLCSFILSVRSVAWTSNTCITEIPTWNLNGSVDILNVNLFLKPGFSQGNDCHQRTQLCVLATRDCAGDPPYMPARLAFPSPVSISPLQTMEQGILCSPLQLYKLSQGSYYVTLICISVFITYLLNKTWQPGVCLPKHPTWKR